MTVYAVTVVRASDPCRSRSAYGFYKYNAAD